MSDEKPFSLININAEALSYSVGKAIDGVSSFLGKVCMPAAEEFGLLSRDQVHAWRLMNVVNIVENSKGILAFDPNTFELNVSPRIVWKIIENGSWTEDKNLQKMWAGLLASSFTKNGKDESNLIYIDLLSRITHSEASFLNYIGEKCKKNIDVLYFDISFNADPKLIEEIPCLMNFDHLARELNHLESLGLIKDLQMHYYHGDTDPWAFMNTTKVALDMYVRCSGSSLPTREYFAQFFKNES